VGPVEFPVELSRPGLNVDPLARSWYMETMCTDGRDDGELTIETIFERFFLHVYYDRGASPGEIAMASWLLMRLRATRRSQHHSCAHANSASLLVAHSQAGI
jgi:hypothetical protein